MWEMVNVSRVTDAERMHAAIDVEGETRSGSSKEQADVGKEGCSKTTNDSSLSLSLSFLLSLIK